MKKAFSHLFKNLPHGSNQQANVQPTEYELTSQTEDTFTFTDKNGNQEIISKEEFKPKKKTKLTNKIDLGFNFNNINDNDPDDQPADAPSPAM